MITKKEELVEAIKNSKDEIVIEGDLANKIIRIKLTGKIAWAVAIAAISAAVVFILSAPAVTVGTAGTGSVISFTGSAATAGAAASILGLPTAITAISIAVLAGGIGVINKLKNNYTIVEKRDGFVKLKVNK